MKNIVSFSGGKDSTAMLLMMIEKGIEVHEIIFCDTTVEFPEMYEHIKKVEEYIKMPITILKAEHNYEYMMFDYVKKKGKNKGQKGYDWGGLYEKFSRVSCWCCPLQSLKELRILYKDFPHLWKILKEWDSRAKRKFRADYSVQELEEKFKKENMKMKLFENNKEVV